MAFLNNKQLAQILPECIGPFENDKIKCGAYELSLGNEFFTTNAKDGVKKILKEGEQLIIEPGQFALLITKEIVKIPHNTLAFISIKAGVKFTGLVNVSGFHVDPGFHGKLKFSVYNAGSRNIVLTEGQKLFPIWFSEFSKELDEDEVYKGHFQNQNAINAEDVMRIEGEILSPSVLNEKMRAIEHHYGNVKIVLSVLITLTAALLARNVFVEITNAKTNALIQQHKIFEQRIDSLEQELKILTHKDTIPK